MKQSKKRGFTIVELVIVIAVIGILAGVLIPTFSNVIEKANESAALQEAQSAMINDLALTETASFEKIVNPTGEGTSRIYEGDYVAATTGEGAHGAQYKVVKNGYTCIYAIDSGDWTISK